MPTIFELCSLLLLFLSSHLMIGQYFRYVADSAEVMGGVLQETRLRLEDLKDRVSFLQGHVVANRASLRHRLSARKLAETARIMSAVGYQLEMLEAARGEGHRRFIARFLGAQAEQHIFRDEDGRPAPWEVKLEGLIQLLGADLLALRDAGNMSREAGPGPHLPIELCLSLAGVREAEAPGQV